MTGGPGTDLFGGDWTGKLARANRICGRPMGKTFSAALVCHYIGLHILSHCRFNLSGPPRPRR
jgi:hypothetical protein